jgi:hypothetical protein
LAGLRLVELPISEDGYHITGAFNDMALHVFVAADAAQ